MTQTRTIELRINGRRYRESVEVNTTLIDFLRYRLGLTGTKRGCDRGDCGACTVIVNDRPVNACLVLAVQADGSSIETIEGVAREGELHPLQQAFIEGGAVQCGFCTPGMILVAKQLLESNPCPSESEVREALSGNLCRCTGYQKIVEAVLSCRRLR
jgi:aerobic carbon-monoxide dehydrogenase small subunit